MFFSSSNHKTACLCNKTSFTCFASCGVGALSKVHTIKYFLFYYGCVFFSFTDQTAMHHKSISQDVKAWCCVTAVVKGKMFDDNSILSLGTVRSCLVRIQLTVTSCSPKECRLYAEQWNSFFIAAKLQGRFWKRSNGCVLL